MLKKLRKIFCVALAVASMVTCSPVNAATQQSTSAGRQKVYNQQNSNANYYNNNYNYNNYYNNYSSYFNYYSNMYSNHYFSNYGSQWNQGRDNKTSTNVKGKTTSKVECGTNTQSQKATSTYIKEKVKQYAESLAKQMEPGKQIDATKLTPIYSNDNKVVGYSVAYHCNKTPYGYVNFDFRHENPVTEFVVQKNCQSLYKDIIENAKKEDSSIAKGTETNKLYGVSPFKYYTSYKDNKNRQYYIGGRNQQESEKLSEKEFTKYQEKNTNNNQESEVHFYDLLEKNFSGNLSMEPKYLAKYTREKSLISQADVERNTRRYGCAIAALTAIAYQEGINKGSMKDTFNGIWDKTGTKVYFTEGNISYGETQRTNLGTGMQAYAKEQGKANTTFTTNATPTVEYFMDAVDKNFSSSLSMTLETSEGREGHCVSVVGYCNTEVTGTKETYLIVADGWYNDAPVYINFNNSKFTNTFGVTYNIQ